MKVRVLEQDEYTVLAVSRQARSGAQLKKSYLCVDCDKLDGMSFARDDHEGQD